MKDDVIQSSSDMFNNPYIDDYRDMYPAGKYVDGSGNSVAPMGMNVIELEKSGVQLQSFGGGRMIISDDANGLKENNDWNSPYEPSGELYSFICTESLSGHQLILNDVESTKDIRGESNGIFLSSATGMVISLNDHMESTNTVGKNHGIVVKSSSGHRIEMCDYGKVFNEENADAFGRLRRYGGMKWNRGKKSGHITYENADAKANADKAYIRITSGYGQYIEINDAGSQELESSQYIMIANKSDKGGSNFIRMDCSSENSKMLLIMGEGVVYIAAKTIFSLVSEGNIYNEADGEYIFFHAKDGIIYSKAKQDIISHTSEGRVFIMTGPYNEDEKKYERLPYPAVIAKSCSRCPLTGLLHYTSLSEHVFLSE